MASEQVCSRDSAQETANRIMEYWASRGYVVEAWPKRFGTTVQGDEESVKTLGGWGVRTNMINGMPRELYEQKQRAA